MKAKVSVKKYRESAIKRMADEAKRTGGIVCLSCLNYGLSASKSLESELEAQGFKSVRHYGFLGYFQFEH